MMINRSYLHLWEIIIPNYNTLGKTVPNDNTFSEIIITKHNTIWDKQSLITSDNTDQAK